jgi:hypothetical protein
MIARLRRSVVVPFETTTVKTKKTLRIHRHPSSSPCSRVAFVRARMMIIFVVESYD